MKHYAQTDMTMDEIERTLRKISSSGRVIGPLSRRERAAGGRISLHLSKQGDSFSFTHKAPARYRVVPTVLKGKVSDGGFTRRICWRVGKSIPMSICAALAIAPVAVLGVGGITIGYRIAGAALTLLAVLLSTAAFLPSREERKLLRDDLYSILRAEDAE